MLDWIFEGIVTWISSIVSEIMDAVSGLFLDALWWREKIRQTLQCHPKQFEHAGRGMWKLKRNAA